MKYLIVNADDFGYSPGVNKGIIKTHTDGIVTSTSIIVDGVASEQAIELKKYPGLSVGLHFNIFDKELNGNILKWTILPLTEIRKIEKDFIRQVGKFTKLVGKPPNHIDGHYHIHLHPVVKPIIEKYSNKNGIPVRSLNGIKSIRSFFGWDKLNKKDLKRISTGALLKILANLEEGMNELMCHPGYADNVIKEISRYAQEREEEIKTLTDKRIFNAIRDNKIKLINWKEIN